jgi:hypothetical protein
VKVPKQRERSESSICKEDTCHEITHFGDSDTGNHRRESFDFASGEVLKLSRSSIYRGHMVVTQALSKIMKGRHSRYQKCERAWPKEDLALGKSEM